MKGLQAIRSIRGGCLALALTLLAGCATVKEEQAVVPAKPRIYVANESSNTVTVIDSATLKVIGTADARSESTHDLSLSRDGTRLYATNLASGRLSVIDTETLESIASRPVGSRCHVVTLTNDNRQVWVASIEEEAISIVDTATFRIVGTIPVGKGPTGLAFSRDGRFAYVSNQVDMTIAIVETTTQRVIKTIPVGPNPHFLVLGPDGRIWGTNTDGNDIYVIDPVTQEKVASLEVGDHPQQIAFAFKGMVGPNAYVTVGSKNKVVVVRADPMRLRILEEIQVGESPDGIAANPEGTRLYVGHEVSNDVRVIDTGTSQVIETVPVGHKPIRVVVSR
jgi:YVTN family beta-propeller protein